MQGRRIQKLGSDFAFPIRRTFMVQHYFLTEPSKLGLLSIVGESRYT